MNLPSKRVILLGNFYIYQRIFEKIYNSPDFVRILSQSVCYDIDTINKQTKGGKENDCLSRKAFLQLDALIILSKITTNSDNRKSKKLFKITKICSHLVTVGMVR